MLEGGDAGLGGVEWRSAKWSWLGRVVNGSNVGARTEGRKKMTIREGIQIRRTKRRGEWNIMD